MCTATQKRERPACGEAARSASAPAADTCIIGYAFRAAARLGVSTWSSACGRSNTIRLARHCSGVRSPSRVGVAGGVAGDGLGRSDDDAHSGGTIAAPVAAALPEEHGLCRTEYRLPLSMPWRCVPVGIAHFSFTLPCVSCFRRRRRCRCSGWRVVGPGAIAMFVARDCSHASPAARVKQQRTVPPPFATGGGAGAGASAN
mmetsp:Transcript_64825/g.180438  ORF Transcript_64825/g.180438 Transcript_64825/m.180438 type:complete len:201 (+) Transcript_64825:871-1473(+)